MISTDNLALIPRVLANFVILVSNPQNIIKNASVKDLVSNNMVPKFQYFMCLFLVILETAEQGSANTCFQKLVKTKISSEESQTRFVDVMSRVELFKLQQPDCWNALIFYLSDAKNNKTNIFEVHDKCSTGTDNLFRDDNAYLIFPKLPLGVNLLSVNPLEFLWNEANSIVRSRFEKYILPQTQPGESFDKVIFHYAAYKLIIDRKDQLATNFDGGIFPVVKKLLYLQSLDTNVASALSWTVKDWEEKFIDGLLTAVVTFAGINLVEGKSLSKEETKKFLNNALTKPGNINAKRARVSVCMFRMIKFDKGYFSLFKFADDYLRTDKVTNVTPDQQKAASFDYCVRKT